MENKDLVVECRDCGKEFTITTSEQAFYEGKGFALPKRCAECRSLRKAANQEQRKADENKPSLEDMMREIGL